MVYDLHPLDPTLLSLFVVFSSDGSANFTWQQCGPEKGWIDQEFGYSTKTTKPRGKTITPIRTGKIRNYSEDPKTGHSKSGIIRKLDFLKVGIQMVQILNVRDHSIVL